MQKQLSLFSYSASLDRRSKDIRVLPIVISELELSNILRHVLPANLVKRTDDTALDDRPKAFNGLSMNGADNILLFGMIDNRMRVFAVKAMIASPLIGAKQADLVRYGFANKGGERIGADIFDDARDDISFSLHGANNRRFTRANAAGSTASAALIPMAVFGKPADKRFVNFDNTSKPLDVFNQRRSDLVAHFPRGLVGTKPHVTHDLQCTHALFACKHEVDHAEPVSQRLVRVLKDRANQHGKAIAIRGAFMALPMPFTSSQVIHRRITATRAANAFWPAAHKKIIPACIFMREHLLKLANGQLVNWFGLFCAGHIKRSFEYERTLSCLGAFVESGIIALGLIPLCEGAIVKRSKVGFGSWLRENVLGGGRSW